jgi:threonine/homoserine/homoserine lactone efflux protein
VGEAIAEVLVLGIGVALSPLAIVAVTLMVSLPNGSRSAAAFLAGWILGLAVIGTLALLLADGVDANRAGAPADWVSALKLAGGLLLLVFAGRQWRSGSAGETETETELPGWMQRIQTLAPSRAAAVAIPISALKPKNLLLTIVAALSIAETEASSAAQAAALAVFVALGALGPAIPVAIHLLMPRRSARVLGDLRTWMVRENTTIVAVLCLIIAVKLIGDALGGLTG